MLIIIIFLILVFILYELYFVNTENFQGESKYDYYFDGDLFLKNNSSRINIGVGTEPDPDYFLNVDGTVTINGDLQIGEAVLNYETAKRINKLPLYSKDKYCLYEEGEGNTNIQCINESELGMVTGHRKLMFQNNKGETLSNLQLKHHGRHSNSESGRPNSDYKNNKWAEGIQYKDLAYKHRDKPTYGKETHDTLQNKSGTNPRSDNQFQLIPITEPDVRVDDDNDSIRSFVIFNIKHGRYIKVLEDDIRQWGDREITDYIDTMEMTDSKRKEHQDYINNSVGITKKEKEENDFYAGSNYPNAARYLKLEERDGKHCIRVEKPPQSGTWWFLNSLGTNDTIDFNDTARTLTKKPMNSSFFTIKQTNGSNYDKNLIKQEVTIKDYSGLRFLSMGTWNGSVFSTYDIRFLNNSHQDDKTLTLYIDPGVIVDSSIPTTTSKPTQEYVCLLN